MKPIEKFLPALHKLYWDDPVHKDLLAGSVADVTPLL